SCQSSQRPRCNLLQHPELHAVGFEFSLESVFALPDLLRRAGTQPDVFIVAGRLGIQREMARAQVARQIGERQVHRTTISQNLRTPRKFFLLILVLVLDWMSGLDYDYEDDDEDDSVAAAPLRHCTG